MQQRTALEELVREQKEMIADQKVALAEAKAGRMLSEQETEIQRQMKKLDRKRAENAELALAQMGQVADKAIKLVEVNKPGMDWKIPVIGGIIGLILLIFSNK